MLRIICRLKRDIGHDRLGQPKECHNGDKKDTYIGIVSTTLEFPSKGILSSNQVRASGHFYDNKPRKLRGKQRLVTTDGREIRILISDGLVYPPVRFPTDEDM